MDMTVFYAAVAAIECGNVGEIEIGHQTVDDGLVTIITVVIRREIRPVDVDEVTE